MEKLDDSENIDENAMDEGRKVNTFEFIILVILQSKWSIGSKIDLILILFDMQSNESISISELLIAIK